ncbi:MAG: hypothetical protein H6Q65_743 [Firmicutes bacterium]|nr:hypothetical protein [Bacillota bacterium]
MGYGMMDGGWFLGGMFMLLFWVVLILGVFYLVRMLIAQAKPSASKTEDTALEILQKRYARGEISHEEFEKMKKNLS